MDSFRWSQTDSKLARADGVPDRKARSPGWQVCPADPRLTLQSVAAERGALSRRPGRVLPWPRLIWATHQGSAPCPPV